MDHLKLRELGIPGCLPDFSLQPGRTALMMIDVYLRSVDRRYGFAARARELGIEHELEPYYDRVENVVIPNLSRLLKVCREKGIDVVHVKVGAQTLDARDAGWRYKGWKMFSSLKEELEICEELRPIDGEVVVSKTTSGVFNSTNIEVILKNLGVEYLIIGGVITGNCVETAVRDASDRDFKVYLLEDCCASPSHEAHVFSIRHMDKNYAHVKTTSEVIQEIDDTWPKAKNKEAV